MIRVPSHPLLTVLFAMNYLTGTCIADAPEVVAWGETGGQQVHLYTLKNANGVILKMTDYGAKVVELWVPDRNGRLADLVLGFDSLEGYLEPNPGFGATIGRYANRISGARFEIDGTVYWLTRNEGDNNLHGAGEFERVVWDSEVVENNLGAGIRFRYRSPDGSEGFPGNLDAAVTYILTDDNAVHITFEAGTDKSTHVNFTQHSYFNLNGMETLILDHRARIIADSYLVMDDVLVTGEIDSLEGKSWDLSEWTRLGDRMQDIPLGGYHHNYVADKPPGELGLVAEVIEPGSGRTLRVRTTQPGLTFYAAMGLTDRPVGKNGVVYEPYIAFCIETQHHTDSVNHAHFPSTLLRPGEKYEEVVIYEFGVLDEEERRP